MNEFYIASRLNYNIKQLILTLYLNNLQFLTETIIVKKLYPFVISCLKEDSLYIRSTTYILE